MAGSRHDLAISVTPGHQGFRRAGAPYGPHAHRTRYERFTGSPPGRWAAVERATAEFVGWLALQPPQDGGVEEVELGYRLKASVWRRGYATEGARALIRKGFTEFGVQRVWAQTMAVNTASRRVLEKAGLRYARTFHPTFDDPLPGTEHGEVEYELRRVDWAGSRRISGCAKPRTGKKRGGR